MTLYKWKKIALYISLAKLLTSCLRNISHIEREVTLIDHYSTISISIQYMVNLPSHQFNKDLYACWIELSR